MRSKILNIIKLISREWLLNVKSFAILTIAVLCCCSLLAQRTDNPRVGSRHCGNRIRYVELIGNETRVGVVINCQEYIDYGGDAYMNAYNNEVKNSNNRNGRGWVRVNTGMVLITSLAGQEITLPIKALRYNGYDQELGVKLNTEGKNGGIFELVFDRLPSGIKYFGIIDNDTRDGLWWQEIKIDNPLLTTPHKNLSGTDIKKMIINNNDGICGIYENSNYQLACIKENDKYSVIYISGGPSKFSTWKLGDVKAELRESAVKGAFKATWYMADKTKNENAYIVFDGITMNAVVNNEEDKFLKMFPSASDNNASDNNNGNDKASSWTGTGWALKNGYIVTNHHVVDGAKTVKVKGIKGNFTLEYNARVEATDANNDLAIIKIDDSRFKGFGAIPYKVKTQLADVGEDVFVLGYPMTTTMGDEIKLTNGIISARTGFQNDATLYQISAPIQPGNSGGPLFDSKGNVIGIVNAHHKGAENVSYAIKTSYLSLLADNTSSTPLLPSNNTIANLSLAEKVKRVKNFVFFISCTNGETSEAKPTDANSKPTYNPSNGNGVQTDITYEYPIVATNKGGDKLTLKSVTIRDNETILCFEVVNTYYYGGWINIDKNSHLLANGTKVYLTRAEGIEIAPDKTYFDDVWQKKTFTLHFAPIPKNTTIIDFIENENSTWQIYGIKLE